MWTVQHGNNAWGGGCFCGEVIGKAAKIGCGQGGGQGTRRKIRGGGGSARRTVRAAKGAGGRHATKAPKGRAGYGMAKPKVLGRARQLLAHKLERWDGFVCLSVQEWEKDGALAGTWGEAVGLDGAGEGRRGRCEVGRQDGHAEW